MKVLLIVNTPAGIATWERAVKIKEALHKRNAIAYLINRKSSRFKDFFHFLTFILRNKDYDIAHIFEPFTPTLPFLYILMNALNGALIYDTGDMHHAVLEISGQSLAKYFIIKAFEHEAFSLADKIIVRGRGMKEILNTYVQLKDKTVWIPDGVDLKRFTPQNSSIIKERLGLPIDKVIIGYASYYRFIKIGKLRLPRGWELILVGRKLLKAGYKNFNILFIGDGVALSELKRMSKSYGLEKHVIFTGFVSSNVYLNYINAMDICFYEGYNHIAYHAMIGRKMREYMACGKAIVASEIGEAKYVLKKAGITVKPCRLHENDIKRYVNDIYNAMLLLIENDKLRKSLGIKARKFAEEYYDWYKIANKIVKLYFKLT